MFFTVVIGLILSAVANSQSKAAGYKNTPAKIGIILGIVFLVLGLIIGIIAIVIGIGAGECPHRAVRGARVRRSRGERRHDHLQLIQWFHGAPRCNAGAFRRQDSNQEREGLTMTMLNGEPVDSGVPSTAPPHAPGPPVSPPGTPLKNPIAAIIGIAGLVFAIVFPPAGLVMGIVARVDGP